MTGKDTFIVDTYSSLTARQQAKELEYSYSWVVHRRGILRKEGFLPKVRAYHPIWTDEDSEYLKQNYPFLTTKTLVKHLKRSPGAIKEHKEKLCLSRVSEDYTAVSLGQLLGRSGHTIARYVSDGFLKGKKSYKMGRYKRWVFNEEQVVKFLRTYPWLLNVRDLTEPHYFRSVLLEEWRENPWYTPAQAANVLGCSLEALRKRLFSGEVPAAKRTNYWRIREKDLLGVQQLQAAD